MMPSWYVYSSAPLKGLLLNGSWSSQKAQSRTRVIWRSFSSPISSKMIQRLPRQLSWRQDNRKESWLKHLWRDLEYGTPISQRYDPSHLGGNMSPQFANLTPNLDRSGWESYLEAVGEARRASRGDHRQGQGWRKRQHAKTGFKQKGDPFKPFSLL